MRVDSNSCGAVAEDSAKTARWAVFSSAACVVHPRYTVVWDLGDVGIGLMTIFNLIALYPMSGEAIAALRDYERRKHLTQN